MGAFAALRSHQRLHIDPAAGGTLNIIPKSFFLHTSVSVQDPVWATAPIILEGCLLTYTFITGMNVSSSHMQVTACNTLTGQESPLIRLNQHHALKIFNSVHPPHNPFYTEPLRIMSDISFSGQTPAQKDCFCFPALFATVLHSTQDDNRKIGYRFFFYVQEKALIGGIICCNCSPAGTLLKDSYLRYGCWTALYRLLQKSEWQQLTGPCWVSSWPLCRWMCHTCVSVGAIIPFTII